MSKYPEDEFDQIDELGHPTGVHRSPRSAWSKIVPFVVVVALCAALAVAAVYVLARTPGSPLDQSSASPSVTSEAGGSPEDPAVEETYPALEDPGATADPEPPVETTPPATPSAPAVDTSVAVRVLNASGRAGVAATATKSLTAAGWTAVSADNYTGDKLNASVVWYRTADLADEARAVAGLLGIPAEQVTLAPSLRGPISVILVGS